jgi:hypothetical protein
MKRLIVPSAVASGLAVLALAQILPNAAPQAAEMQMKPPVNVEDIKWGPAPPNIPPGAQLAVVAGDSSKEGLFTMRLKMPANYKVPAHHHPTDEFVTVISGDFRVGLGDKLDMDKGQSRSFWRNASRHEPLCLDHGRDRGTDCRTRAVRYHLRQPGRRPKQTGCEIAGEKQTLENSEAAARAVREGPVSTHKVQLAARPLAAPTSCRSQYARAAVMEAQDAPF